jgi:5-formaminoimidazole-4-carboxamide-1-beta-D-ribofuranosyl 5'-monophosphate synthetase
MSTKARELAPGIIGPFCLETVITDEAKIYTFEISAASSQEPMSESEHHHTLI